MRRTNHEPQPQMTAKKTNPKDPVNACPECGKEVYYNQQRMGYFCVCGWSHYKVSDGRWIGTKPPKTL